MFRTIIMYYSIVLTLAALLAAPVQAVFPDSPITRKYKEIVAEAKDALETVETDNGKTLKRQLIDDPFARSGGVNVSILDLMKYVPLAQDKRKCAWQQFGKVFGFSKLICGAYDSFLDICESEDSCDPSEVPYLLAAKAKYLEDTAYMQWALCLMVNDFSLDICTLAESSLPQSQIYALAASGVQMLLSMSPDGIENSLFTADQFMVSSDVNPDTFNMLIGDGKIDFINQAYNKLFRRRPWVNVDLKLLTMDALIYQYSPAHPNFSKSLADDDSKEFFTDAMRGYFGKKYVNQIFNKMSEKNKLIDVFRLKYNTICAASLGVLVASKCGYDPEEMMDFLTYYLSNVADDNSEGANRFCPTFIDARFIDAKKAVRGVDSTIKLEPADCVNALNL